MGETLDALQSLQKVESKLTALRAKIEAKKRAVTAHSKRLAGLELDIQSRHDTVKRQQAEIDALELEVRTKDAEISKLREALNKSKSNKEYAAILTQINTDKADNSKLEDRILSLMSGLEDLRKQEQAFLDRLNKEKQTLENAAQVASAFELDSQEEMAALEAERSGAAACVPPTTLDVFNRVAERHEGEALASVIQPHPKRQDFICDGCNMTVTLEQYSALQTKDKVQLCGNCGRVLILESANS